MQAPFWVISVLFFVFLYGVAGDSCPSVPNLLAKSAPGGFLQARRLDIQRPTNGEHPVVARSYNGNDWEPVPDQDFAAITLDCTVCSGYCAILDDGNYAVEALDVPVELVNPDTDARWSRLLLQSTFGVSKDELQSVVTTYGSDHQQWILDQMSLPVTSHRAYYRQRVNPRRPAGSDVGPMYEPCEAGSRYHRYVFNKLDQGKILFLHNDEAVTLLTMKIEGQVRGEISNFNGLLPSNESVAWPLSFTICSVEERLNGSVVLGVGNTCNVDFVNPIISITNCASNIKNVAPSQAVTVPVSNMPGAIVIQSMAVTCQGHPATNSFIRYGGELYRFDPRVKTFRNSLSEPIQRQAENSNSCPAVVKTFLNEDTCIRAPSCNPLSFTAATMVLNEENLRAWYVNNNLYVYEIRDLTLEEPFNVSPCSGTSRWKYATGTCSAPTVFGDTTTEATLRNALANSTDSHPFLRDISLQGNDCTPYAETIGAQIQIGTQCFTHVHPDLHNVYEFTYWVNNHDGNESAFRGGRPNPIARWAEQGLTYLQFPWHHPAERWAQKRQYFTLAGRKDEVVSFDSLDTTFQTEAMAARVGALASRSDEGSEACGSPSEVENNPALGDRFQLVDTTDRNDRAAWLDNNVPHLWQGKQTVWYNVVLRASDRLRQRVGWAISQIIPVSEVNFGTNEWTETWTNYYDIFVRHAFGNYRDILREVSFSPLMARYLTFSDNRAYSRSGTYPDENYAREVMQLFSVGLWVLNEDGSLALDDQGKPVETYTNEDILDFARLWTGFDDQPVRGNIELYRTSVNGIDPMQIKPDNRDLLPKAKLGSGYLGDRYPDCHHLPAFHWLKRGATYHYTGESSVEGVDMDAERPNEAGIAGRFTAPASSALYQAICQPDQQTGECSFPPKVVLDTDLPCTNSAECASQMIISVKIIDTVANVSRYYTYESVPCAKLAFFGEGARTQTSSTYLQCADPAQPVGRPVCCTASKPDKPISGVAGTICKFANEAVDYFTAFSRCQALGYQLCDVVTSTGWSRTCANYQFVWVNQTCSLSVQVYPTGRVGIVDPIASANGYPDFKILQQSSNNVFRVRWENDEYPSADQGCPAGCSEVTTLVGQSCLCDYTLTNSVVYTDTNNIPSRDEVLETLFQGATHPSLYGGYNLCSSCASSEGVQVWLSASNVMDEDTIFEVTPTLAGRRTHYLLNRLSMVSVGSFAFRNPPRFMQGAGELNYRWRTWNPTAVLIPATINEVEDALDHLFEHPSTAPFVAYRLIQRLVTSNPSPRYMKSVVTAFRTGEYNGVTYSGEYGDMAATVAAVLLDPEARTPMLEADPTFGVMREPIVKLMQVFNAFELQGIDERETILNTDIYGLIGMEPYSAPTVFGFFLPEARPEGPINDLGIVSPESQLAITPNLFGLLNGLVSLVDSGFTPCSFGYSSVYVRCSQPQNYVQGTLNYTPDDETDPASVVDELDLLLTGKRLSTLFKQHVVDRYNETMISSSPSAALKLAQKLILMSPEYHVSNAHKSSPTDERPPVSEIASQGRPYKAIVVIIQGGGADTFNLVVPHSNCSNGDLNAEYETVRQGAKIAKSRLLPISVPSGTQPCNVFGVHPAFPKVKGMYDQGEVAFFANTGALVEPITKADYFAKPLQKELPPSLFAHNIMTRNTQNLHPQNAAAAGVLGRAITALRNQTLPWRSEMYSVAGANKILEGGNPDFVSSSGIAQFSQYDTLSDDIDTMTEFLSQSPMAETYLDLLTSALNRTQRMGGLFNGATLNTTFPKSNLATQMATVAKLIKLRSSFQTERDVFVTVAGGFDTHTTFDLDGLFTPIDDAIGAFRQEMIQQGAWDDVTVLTISEFARTLTSNGGGTDHGWGGNYFLVGGSVNGGQMLGHYPEKLTEDGDEHIGRGRLLPTSSWDAVWNGLLQWFGVEDDQLAQVLPNLANFPSNQIFSEEDLFSN